MQLYSGQLKTEKLEIYTHRKHHKQKNGKSPITRYCNTIFTFDIECTSAFITEEGKIIKYTKGKSNEYWNNLEPISLCYIWQFSVNGNVYYGRELKDFIKVLDDFPKDTKCIIWVHNLSYEFQFLRNILEWDSVFCRSARKPIKCVAKEYPDIEWRCSYMLTRLSLDSWGKQLGVHKQKGDLDYEEIRTPLTPLTDKELKYCEYDCLVLEAGIKDYIKRYTTVFNIPLTQTGIVRKILKDKLMNNPKYAKNIKRLVPKNADEYKILQNVFAGGYTHANRLYAGEIVEDEIEHYDFASSYPAVMVAEKYPMSPWYTLIDKKIPSDEEFEDKAYIMKLQFRRLNSTSFNTYLQASKCIGNGYTLDNGRIIRADLVEIYVTEQDWITIRNNYEWEELNVLELYVSYKDYLPREFISYILELYSNKTELKDVEGMEDLYMQSKQYINSLFGTCVTAIVQAEIDYDNGEWNRQILTKEIVDKKLQQLSRYSKYENKYFLSYSWGCWVTAYARRNLWKCIESCDMNVIYCDTDSIFCRGKQDFNWYNEEITDKLLKTCNTLGLDFNKTRPFTPKGIQKPLGIFAKEDNCIQFKTLGAKRYCERRDNGKLYLTVSGINKGAVELLNNDLDNFVNGFNFDKDADCVNKRLCTYIENQGVVKWNDGYISDSKYGINLRRTGYLLTVTDEYEKLYEYSKIYLSDVDEQIYQSMRGYWI